MSEYIIITPAKNEESVIENTIKSVINQLHKPKEWVIVDDGSEDNTPQIISKYSKNYPWIKAITLTTKNEKREEGPKIVRTFYEGYKQLSTTEYLFLVKLDADILLPENYFLEIAKNFEANSNIGLCGGQIENKKNDKWIKEKAADYHLRGAIKAYRKECFNEIGGLKQTLGWDGIDEMAALYKGWEIVILDLWVRQQRPTHTYYKKSSLYYKLGYANYKNGGSFILIFIRSLFRLFRRPYLICGLYYLTGYMVALLKQEDKNVDKDFAKFINDFHYTRAYDSLKKILHFKIF